MPTNLVARSRLSLRKIALLLIVTVMLCYLLACQGVSSGNAGNLGQSAGTLSLSASKLDFGTVTIGGNQSLQETLSNTGGSALTISQAAMNGTGFALTGINLPLTLAAGDSTSFTITFTPVSSGNASGSVTITSSASNSNVSIPLSGAGTSAIGQLSVTPASLDLGNVAVGASGTASGTLTATGANVTVTAATTDNSSFTVGGLSLPVTILAGQSIPFTITFSPATAAAASATLSVTSNAQSSTITETLTGTGTSSSNSSHSVALSWNQSTSLDVAGYNVYRAVYTSSCGTFSKINSSLVANTVYTDSTVANSTSYCYATTAMNTSNQESSFSNIISNVQIPAQ